MKPSLTLLIALLLAACAKGPFAPTDPARSEATLPDSDVSEPMVRPQSRPSGLRAAPKPPAAARTVEQFDTTTQAERAAAAAQPEPASERALGETIASLGDPTKPGFWLETPLVKTAQTGRVMFPASGKSAQVELLPIDGPATAGSRISLAAMRLIDAPLTDLPTVLVFTGG